MAVRRAPATLRPISSFAFPSVSVSSSRISLFLPCQLVFSLLLLFLSFLLFYSASYLERFPSFFA